MAVISSWQSRFAAVVLLALVVGSSFLYFGEELRDSRDYKEVTKFIQGRPAELTSPFAMRPVIPAVVALAEPFVGFGIAYGILNVMLAYASALLLFYFAANRFGYRAGFVSAVLFSVSLPVVVWGFRMLTDMAGFFIIIAGVVLIERWERPDSPRKVVLGGLFLALSLLTREIMGFLLVYWVLRVLRAYRYDVQKAVGENAVQFFAIGAIMFFPFFIWKAVTAQNVHTAWFSWFNMDIVSWSGIWVFLFRSFVAFHLAWILLVGSWNRISMEKDAWMLDFLFVMVPVLLFTMVTTHIFSPRYVFMLFPMILPLAAVGLISFSDSLSKRTRWDSVVWSVLFIGAYALLSFIGALAYPSRFVGDQGVRLGSDFSIAIQELGRRFT